MNTESPIRFAICNEIFKDWPLEKTFEFVARCGYNAIEIAPFTIAKSVTDIPSSRRAEIRALAAQHKIAISGIHWVLVQTEGLHLPHPDQAVRERTSDYFVELVNFCADIGGGFIVVGSPKQRNLLEGVAYEQAWEWAAGVFRKAVERAEELGIVICFEPLSPVETNFINTAEEAVRFTAQFGSTSFKIILDVKAMSSESKPIPQIISDSWPDFAYFHANDRNLKGPGFGDVDFAPIADALHRVGYKGYVSVEVFNFDEGPERIATQSLATLRAAFRKE